MTRNGIGYEHELGGHRRRWPCAARYTDPFLPAEIDWCVAPRSTTAGMATTTTAVTRSGAGSANLRGARAIRLRPLSTPTGS
jgi:hypothetical protein